MERQEGRSAFKRQKVKKWLPSLPAAGTVRMYLKLMFRGLLRHRRSGKRLFILLALCSAAILVSLAFMDSFNTRFRQLVIDISTSHLQIIPVDSPKISEDGNCTDHRGNLILLNYSREMESYLQSLPVIKSAMLAVETRAAIFTLEGEPAGSTPSLVGVDPTKYATIFPGATVVEGKNALAWPGGKAEVPIYRPKPMLGEIVKDNDRFVRENFRLQGKDWAAFKQTIVHDLPGLFPLAEENLSDEAFLRGMNAGLGQIDLPELLKARSDQKYNYHVEDALVALTKISDPKQLKVARKRLLQNLYPDAIIPVPDALQLDVPYTLSIPPLSGNELDRQVVLPVRIAAYVERMPMFYGRYYVDARIVRERLGLSNRQGTNIYLRLASEADVLTVKKTVNAWLLEHHLPYVVKDYNELGKLFISTAAANSFISLILIVLFVVTVTIFIVNTVLMAMLKRRREIGTALALGLTPWQNILIMFGEMIVLMLAAWGVGAIAASGLILIMHSVGMPGVMAMPGSRLFLDFRPAHLAVSLFIILMTSGPASLIPLLRFSRIKPITLLKEAL